MNLKIILSKIFSTPITSSIFAISVIIGMLFFSSMIFLYQNIENYMIQKRIGTLLPNSFEISPSGIDINSKKLSSGDIETLKSFSNVKDIKTIYSMNLPTLIQINIFGNIIESDMIIYGVSDSMLTGENILPIGISNSLLDLYNTQIAGGSYPKLSQELLKALNIKLFFGKSQIFSTKNIVQKDAKVTTFSPNFPLAGISIPQSQMREILKNFDSSKTPQLIKILATTTDGNLASIRQKYSDFSVKSDDDTLNSIHQSLQSLRSVISLLIGVMLFFLIAVIFYMVFSSKQQNDKIFFIYRVHGASRLDLANIIIFEALAYSILGGTIIFLLNFLLKLNQGFLNNLLFEKGNIDFFLNFLEPKIIFYIIILHFLLLSGIGLMMNGKNIRKKFES